MSHSKLYYRFIQNEHRDRLEFHVAADKKEVVRGEALSKAIALSSNRLVEWKEEMLEQVKFFGMKEVK